MAIARSVALVARVRHPASLLLAVAQNPRIESRSSVVLTLRTRGEPSRTVSRCEFSPVAATATSQAVAKVWRIVETACYGFRKSLQNRAL